ncbi:Asp23/Gls24 family envelope stress response protein [Actinomycetospora soli]|uniref:Asp23/Gls24 family envelope stress response protein n=1 Tax=Actinomycetospora soli TaxID=2893887 RepID=UPI001E3341CE|nr:Asp23/Gls24 family envelope stress response protein [Actinomycetospora soli]MCD2186899.1 Asp23/Gls24 family envelope stress response protein [Actinomycetospora soli]
MSTPGPHPTPAVVGGLDVDRIATAVQACPLVVGLHPGLHGAVATLLPGRRVPGVRVVEDDDRPVRLEIAVTAPYGAVLARVGEQVRAAVAPLAPGLPAEVTVADIA